MSGCAGAIGYLKKKGYLGGDSTAAGRQKLADVSSAHNPG